MVLTAGAGWDTGWLGHWMLGCGMAGTLDSWLWAVP